MVIKSLENNYRRVAGVSGATIMGSLLLKVERGAAAEFREVAGWAGLELLHSWPLSRIASVSAGLARRLFGTQHEHRHIARRRQDPRVPGAFALLAQKVADDAEDV